MESEDKRKNNGGKRKGSGRKSKAEEMTLIKKIDRFVDTNYLLEKVISIIDNEKGRDADKLKAISMLMEYRWGKPTQTIDSNNTHTIQDFDITKLYGDNET